MSGTEENASVYDVMGIAIIFTAFVYDISGCPVLKEPSDAIVCVIVNEWPVARRKAVDTVEREMGGFGFKSCPPQGVLVKGCVGERVMGSERAHWV